MAREGAQETLKVNPIFLGLTRPPMLMGVTVDFLFIAFVVAQSSFMMTSSPVFLVVYFPLHLFGWMACKFDPNFFRVLVKKIECPNIKNKKLWGSQSYEPL